MSTENELDQRIRSAFFLLVDHFDAGEQAKAFKFFQNIVRTEVSIAVENERKNTNKLYNVMDTPSAEVNP